MYIHMHTHTHTRYIHVYNNRTRNVVVELLIAYYECLSVVVIELSVILTLHLGEKSVICARLIHICACTVLS